MSLFSVLPTHVTRSILTDWLKLKDVARLDSSVSNAVLRPQFLDILSSSVFPIKKWGTVCKRQLEYYLIGWFLERAMRVTALDVGFMQADRVKSLLQLTGKHLASIQMASFDSLALVAEMCSNLLHLSYSGKELDQAALFGVLSANPNLKHMELRGLLVPKRRVNHRPVGVNCPNLRTLCVFLHSSDNIDSFMSQVERFTMPLLLSLLANADQLRALSLRMVYFNSSDSWVKLLQNCAQLCTLELHHVSFMDESLDTIATMCPHIVNLDVTGCEGITDEDIEYIAQHLQLRSLYLDGCSGLSTASLSSLLRYSYSTLTALSVLNTFTGSEMRVTMSLCALLTSCKLLTTLCMGSRYLRDGYMQRLTKIRIASMNISDQALKILANNCTSVEYLCLDENFTIRDTPVDLSSIRLLLDKCTKLHTLVLSNSMYPIVKQVVIDEYAHRAPQLHLSGVVSVMKLSVMDVHVA